MGKEERKKKGEIGETFELKGADKVKARRARDGGRALIRVLLTRQLSPWQDLLSN